MGINVSEIQDKTFLMYAQKVDDGDGVLNEQEMNSLFETLNMELQKSLGRLEASQKIGIGNILGTSALWTAGSTGLVAYAGKVKPNNIIKTTLGLPKLAGIIFAGCVTAGAITVNQIKKNANNKVSNLEVALEELKQHMQPKQEETLQKVA